MPRQPPKLHLVAPGAAAPDPGTPAAGMDPADAFEHALVGMALVRPDGRLVRVNRAFGDMLGYAPDELRSRLLREICTFGNPGEDDELAERMLAGTLDGWRRERRYLRRDGRQRWAQFSCTVMRDPHGDPSGFLFQAQDVTDRRHAEQALRESEGRFRSLNLLSSDWYWEQDEQLRFTVVAPQEQAAQFGAREVMGLRRWELSGTVPISSTWEEHRLLLEQRASFRDFTYLRRAADDATTIVAVSGEPVFAADGSFLGYRGVARDLTAQLAAEGRLRSAQAVLQMAARMGRFGAWAWDVGAPGVSWSEELCAIHGLPAGSEPTPREGLSFVAPEYRERIGRLLRRCRRFGEPFDVEVEVLTAAGDRLWVRMIGQPQFGEGGEVVRIHGASQDISEMRKAAARVRQLAGQLTTTLESITDAFYTLDTDWCFSYVNAEAERLLRRPRGELLGRPIWSEYPDLAGTRVRHHYEQAMREQVPVQFDDHSGPLGLWMRVKAYPSRQGLAIHIRDVTEKVQARHEILRLNAELEERVRQRTSQLEEANRELESFSYSIAHDLRAPLGSIDGFSQVLEERLGASLDGRDLHYLQRIRRAVRHMGELTEGLLALANLSRASMRHEPVDLAALARGALDLCRQQSPGREARVVVPHALPAQGDPRLLAQVMGNLVGNAWKFTSRTADARIEVGVETESGEPVFFVRDNGAGFDMAYAGKLFAAFQRLHPGSEFEGTGIGLAIVHRIVHRHGGRIWAEAAPGQGACFRFTLAAGAAHPAARG